MECQYNQLGVRGIKGEIHLNNEYQDGLKDLDRFSHIILIYHLHLSKGQILQVKPFLDNQKHGIFATRAPKRPNLHMDFCCTIR